jgi:hypothetical protein
MPDRDPVRIIPHSVIPDAGSFEVIWPGGHRFFYWDDVPGRRLRPDAMSQSQALEAARELARTERAKLEHACPCCDGTGWVCEEHQDQPWEGPHACTCGAAGAPCPHCNQSDDGAAPRMPPGFEPDAG